MPYMSYWTPEILAKVSGPNSGRYLARLAGHLFKAGNGLQTTPEAVRLLRILWGQGLISEEFDAAAYGVKIFRSAGAQKRVRFTALRDKERGKVVATTKKKFGVDIDSPDFCLASALEIIESKVGK